MSPQPGPVAGRLGGAFGWRPVSVGLVVLLVLAACDRGATEPVDTTAVVEVPTTPAAPTTTTTAIATTTTTLDVTAEVLAAWDGFWGAWAVVRASEDLDPAPLEAVAGPEVVEGVMALFGRQRESDLGAVVTEVVTHGKVMELEPGVAVVEDCVLLAPSFIEMVGVWYQAELRTGGAGWMVADLRIRSTEGCVPEEMASEAIAAYEAYYEAVAEFWQPPDPDHPLIREVLAEPRLSNVIALLELHKGRGVAFRSSPTTYPEVIEVRSPTELVILDCYEPDLADGLYDIATGERLEDESPVRGGQRNLRSAVMVFEDGKWKSSDFQGQVDFACEFAPTERGLPPV